MKSPLPTLAPAAVALCAFALSGCAALDFREISAAFDTRVISSVPTAVTIQTFGGQERAESIAQVECAKYRKRPQLRSGFRPDYSFYCVD